MTNLLAAVLMATNAALIMLNWPNPVTLINAAAVGSLIVFFAVRATPR